MTRLFVNMGASIKQKNGGRGIKAQAVSGVATKVTPEVESHLRIGHLRLEKCELLEAEASFLRAFELAKTSGDRQGRVESLVGLLRFAGEALDEVKMKARERELDVLIAESSADIPPMALYSKGFIAASREQWSLARRYYLRCVRAARTSDSPEVMARALAMLANVNLQRGRLDRAEGILGVLISRYESRGIKGLNGAMYIQRGIIEERRRSLPQALQWYRKAHAAYLAEHNWYHHLYVLYGYARVARLQQNYSQSYWYLDLMEKAATGPEFGILRREIARERERLEGDAVDLVIDGRNSTVKTRERGAISLGKQYVLLDILHALSRAHSRNGEDTERGLTKAEIIEQVWRENYRPEAHDNKLYYNINRLRKLIEPDVRKPQYLLSWKEGYRLSPGLRVFVERGGEKNETTR